MCVASALDPSSAPTAALPQRVVVLGVTGSGKTTAAAAIARLIDAKHIELDALNWDPGWSAVEPAVLQQRLREAIAGVDRWVTDGGYASYVWDITWPEADTIIWLDFPLWLTIPRIFRRTMSRWFRSEELWNGNRESLRQNFASKDSLFLWAFKSHKKYQESYPAYFARPELAYVRVLRLESLHALDAWLRELKTRATDPAAPAHSRTYV